MTKKIERERVLAVLRTRSPRSIHLGEICNELAIEKTDRDAVLNTLEALTSEGFAAQLPGRKFRLVRNRKKKASPARPEPRRRRSSSSGEELQGRLHMHPSGFGFVKPDEGGDDVFIPPGRIGSSLHGDVVRIRARPSPKGREGDIVSVVKRGITRVGGVLRRAGGNHWLEPDDPRMRGPMPVRGRVPSEAEPGDQVVGDIIEFPKFPDEFAEVTITDVLGPPGSTDVEVAKLKIRDGILESFEEDVLAEARAFPDRVTPAEKKDREDLRDYDLCTIDPDDARDHDDALWGERTKNGYRCIVAIADVSHYVQPGTAIDAAALERGCSIYLPDRAIPMLPRELSSSLASLVPKKDRLTMAVEVELSAAGAITKYRFIEGVMRSKARLTYGGVARALGLTDEGPSQKEALSRLPMLETLMELAETLKRRRVKRGAMDFDLPQARIKLDEDDEPIDSYRQKSDPGVRKAYGLVEEFMLLANEIVGADLAKRGVPAIYRVHGVPDEAKLLKFVEFANALGHKLTPDEALKTKSLAKFVRSMHGKPEAQGLNYLLLRAMQQAEYDPTNIGHFGLGAKHYIHFTSPIRRYPDLAVHRVLRAVIRNERFSNVEKRKQLKAVSIESSRLERRAMKLERDVVDLYRCVLMKDRVGEEFEGTVGGISQHGFYLSLDEPYVEVLCPIEALGPGVEIDELGVRISSQVTGLNFKLGDRVKVRLEEVSLTRRQIVAVPAFLPAADSYEDPSEFSSKSGKPKRVRPSSRQERKRATTSSRKDAPGKGTAKRAPRKGTKKGDARRGAPKKGTARRKKPDDDGAAPPRRKRKSSSRTTSAKKAGASKRSGSARPKNRNGAAKGKGKKR